MNTDRRREIERVCGQARAREPEARGPFVEASCAGDPDLRREVESLLAQQSEAHRFLEGPVGALALDPGPASSAAQNASLAAGMRLGPYEIVGPIGSGGMGEVYKARDTRLERTVAIKVLPLDVTTDPGRRARFELEARSVAALNHPHICTLYDVGHHPFTDGCAPTLYLVMEYLAGDTLAHRLSKGPLRLEQALEVGVQVADALAAAHRAGIIHRDLKPGNIMLTKSGVKLLDFGLAKLRMPAAQRAAASTATQSMPLTGEGTLLGTLRYMAPEQLEAKEADARADIWALGLVLYQMVTGKHPFEANSEATLIAAVLEHEPLPLTSVQPLVPAALERLVRKCLAKSPDDRWQSAQDVADELRWVASEKSIGVWHYSPGQLARWRFLALASFTLAAVVLLAAVAGILAWRARPAAPAPLAERAAFSLTDSEVEPDGGIGISPDGRLIAFAGRNSAGTRLYVRRMDQEEVRALKGTEGADQLCFSADNEWITFTVSGRQTFVRRISTQGGASELITQGGALGLACAPDGRILFAPSRGREGIWSIGAGGGTPQAVVRPQDTGIPGRYGWPEPLPDGHAVLFTIWFEGKTSIWAFSPQQPRPIRLVEGIRPRYLPETGHVVYQLDGRLLAVPFDPERLATTGEARVVADNVGEGSAERPEYHISRTGVLAYLPPHPSILAWKDRTGTTTPLPFKPRPYNYVKLSPDGRRAVLGVVEGTAHRLYLANLEVGEPPTRLTPGDDDFFGLFTADGSRVFYTSGLGGRYNIASTRADGLRVTEELTNSPYSQKATSIWPLGPVLLFNQSGDERFDVLQLDIERPGIAPRPVVKTAASDLDAVFSPDGRWIAYEQSTYGDPQVFIQGYPSGPRAQVSAGGGSRPMWNPKRGELFYQTTTGVMAVRVTNGVPGPAMRLFEQPASHPSEMSTDGDRFLVIERTRVSQINVVFNWFEELKGKVPVRR